ncbi:MAG: hypothetical protein K2K12_01095, partial [Clostridia bacterium]|nr:hypothetical protein [Clostridia bacterium]
MAKFFVNGKWKKRSIAALSMALSLTFSLGIFTACGSPDKEDDDDDGTSSTEVDVQLLKNGNFEFYSEKDKELDEKRALINSPASWSFSSGSPSSKTSSGIISVSEWDYLTKAGYNDGKGFPENGEGVDTAAVIAEVAAHWNDESVTAYDRLKFYDDFSKEIKDLSENSTEAKLFADYKYSIDYEDVEALREELGDKLLTHPTAEDEEESENLLMIHNSIEQYDVLGTAQHYT